MVSKTIRFFFILTIFANGLWAQAQHLELLNGNWPVLDAHNCYPYQGRWADRIERALSTGFPVAIEQDLAWYVDPATNRGRVVVSHTPHPTGAEPTLRHYFFERVRPVMEKALQENHREKWPLIVLHFDFKDNQLPLLRAVWALLGEYESWITTARKTGNAHELQPYDRKPLLVLTEDSDAQERVFFTDLAEGARLRLFGSAHTNPVAANNETEKNHLLATLPPDKLLSERPTNYRRWWNNSWYVVEEGGEASAGLWTDADDARLRSLVNYAHGRGYCIRFYTLDGFAPEADQGWGRDYNFGSTEAVRLRWKAALEAGVNLIATDQYETLAQFMRRNLLVRR
ncbi:MAG TPA: hypothetical protein VH601_03825 [Bryobacteraceae bacterium]|jgi:hypothetical protein